jgi:alpha-amylase/alpha-mannosidase (GH57 family)
MHQPWYVEPSGDRLMLPWVRLHGVSAYSEMGRLLADHPEVHATVSFSPSLIDQIHLYLEGREDVYEELTNCPAAELSNEQRLFLARHFFSVHWGRVLPEFAHYHELLTRRGPEIPVGGWKEATDRLSTDDFRDLQVMFNLAWLGSAGLKHPAIAPLVERGGGFIEGDKRRVLDRQHEVLEELLSEWRRLVNSGSVEISTSPYYHPILPLLIDTNIARRSSPQIALPDRFSHPEDASAQVARSLVRLKEEFGVTPSGVWVPEGGISHEVARLGRESGLRYLTADGELLFHSLDVQGSTPGRSRLPQPFEHEGCTIIFRDAFLSRLVSEEYATWEDSEAGAADLVERIVQTGAKARTDSGGPPLVVIALDGENPWEAYPDRGRPFLDAFYRRLTEQPEIRTVTIQEHLDEHPEAVGLDYLHSGSRIETNFDVWIGDPAKNHAWNLLGRARERLQRAERGAEVDSETLAHAREHILRAEASDWFWWLGEPFSSVEEPIYDALFREHLMEVYRILNDAPPADLSRRIEQGGIIHPLRAPTTFIQPRIDGSRTSFFEWRGAGFYRVPAGGSMYQEQSFINGLYWGFDPGRLFLRIDPVESYRDGLPLDLGELKIRLELSGPTRMVRAQLSLTPDPHLALAGGMGSDAQLADLGTVEEVAYRDVLELAIPIARLGFAPGTRVGLSVHFSRDGQELSVVPSRGVIEIEIPSGDIEAKPAV